MGYLVVPDGKPAEKEYGIIAQVGIQVIFAEGGVRPDEGTDVTLREDVTETLDGKPGPGYSRELKLKDNEDGNSYYGSDTVGLINADSDGQGPSTEVYKGEQKITVQYKVDGKLHKEVIRTNSLEVNMKTNTITIKELTKP